MSAQSGSSPTPIRPWQDSLHTVGAALNFLLASGTHSDVTLVVGREGKQFKASRTFFDNTLRKKERKNEAKSSIRGALLFIFPARIDDIKMNKINAMTIHFTNGTRALCNSIPCDLHVTGSVSRKAFLSVRNNVPCNTRNN